MATGLDPALSKRKFSNWIKGALATLFAKEGLTEFVRNEISDFQKDLLQSVWQQNAIPFGTTCCSCTTANLLKCPTKGFCRRGKKCALHDQTEPNKKPDQMCPKNICHNARDLIIRHHRFDCPTWHITDATRWFSDAIQIAKCYLPPGRYDHISSFDEIDTNGLLEIIINNRMFKKQMTAQSYTCLKVRDMIRENIRHSSNFELSDVQLAQCLEFLRDLLLDSKRLLHDSNAQLAVYKINQLQNKTLVLTKDDLTKVLDKNISERVSYQHNAAVQSIQDHLNNVKTASVASLEDIIDAKEQAAMKARMEELVKIVKQYITDLETDDVLYKNLQEDLINFYRINESMINASPLVDEHKVPLEELYVLPPMWAYASFFEKGKDRQNGQQALKQKITVRQIFLSDKNVRYKRIYLTANAGLGKTSLSQKLTMAWCQNNSPLKSLIEKYDDAELDALRYFDLLFLLHLRDYQGNPICNLDDLIMNMLSQHLSRNPMYPKEFISRMLHKKNCLIILDGLDEWSHPGHCRKTPQVPHNYLPDSCTVLTTTREWKIGNIGISQNHIDLHVEISELDDETRMQLEQNAVQILNEHNLNLTRKDIEDFDKEVRAVEIGNIILIPYVLLQFVCIYFGGLSIGKSKCEIYSNSIEFTLERGLNKTHLPDIHVQSNYITPVPDCMKQNETCKRYFVLLMKLGQLAFYTLFSEKRESSSIFDRRKVAQYITEQEIEFCLKVGLLCQTKDSSIISMKRYNVFFQHQSVQEFMAALYITSEWQNENVKYTIFKACPSTAIILELSNLFAFACGMNPEVYTCISYELKKIVDQDSVILRYRASMYNDDDAVYNENTSTVKSYQSMQVKCCQESVRNGNENCSIHLQDIVLDRDSLTEDNMSALYTLMHFNKGQVKSLRHSDEKTAELNHSLISGVFTSLETLTVRCKNKEVWLADILTESARTLKCVSLLVPIGDITIMPLTEHTGLQSVYLDYVTMSHSNLKCIYTYISQTTTITQLKLKDLHCSNHEDQCYLDCDVTLDLHRLNQLKMLELRNVPCKELQVNPICMEKLMFSSQVQKLTVSACASLWEDLRGAIVLSSLELHDMESCQEMELTIPTLSQLRYLKLVKLNMGNRIMRFSPAMKKLERVELDRVKMSPVAWKEMFLSVRMLPRNITIILESTKTTLETWRELLVVVGDLPQSVIVKLMWCKGPSIEEWNAVVDMIEAMPALSLIQVLSICSHGASLTLKTKIHTEHDDVTELTKRITEETLPLKLTNGTFFNWLKGNLAIHISKAGLMSFIANVITAFHDDLMQIVYKKSLLPSGTVCNLCTTANVLECPTPVFCSETLLCNEQDLTSKILIPPCPNGFCDTMKEEILKEHISHNPSWENTDARKWCSDTFQLARCYMPIDDYTHANSMIEADLISLLSLVINCKRFHRKLSARLNTEPSVCSRARSHCRDILHSKDNRLSDFDFNRSIKALLELLRDPAYLQYDENAQEAVNKLQQLKRNTLIIQADDFAKAMANLNSQSLSQQQTIALQALQEHMCTVRTESLSAMENLVSASVCALKEKEKTSTREKQYNPDAGTYDDPNNKQPTQSEDLKIIEPINWDNLIQLSDFNANLVVERLLKESLPNQAQLNQLQKQYLETKSKMISDLLKKIEDGICKSVKSNHPEIKQAWLAYTTDDNCSLKLILEMNMPADDHFDDIFYDRQVVGFEDFSMEEREVSAKSEKYDYSTFKNSDEIRDCINKNADKFLNHHRHLSIIKSSPVRSKGFNLSQHKIIEESCLVLYIRKKGFIPAGEEPFEEKYDGFPVDVREGAFYTNMDAATSSMDPLKMGCHISRKRDGINIGGTLGGFIDHPEYGLCGLTCAHCLLDENEMKDLVENGILTEFDKADVYLNTDKKVGRLVKAVYDTGQMHSMIDAAIFQIQEFAPNTGLLLDRESNGDGPVYFNTGKIYAPKQFPKDQQVFKFGAKSGKTFGKLCKELTSCNTYVGEKKIALYNFIEVKNIVNNFNELGDSGSSVMMYRADGELVCIGIIEGFVKPHGISIVIPISRALEKLDVSSFKNFEIDQLRIKVSSLEKYAIRLRKELTQTTDSMDETKLTVDRIKNLALTETEIKEIKSIVKNSQDSNRGQYKCLIQ